MILPSFPTEQGDWERHLEAALAMGLTARDAFDTFTSGFHGMAKASRERQDALQALLDAERDD